MSNVTTQTTCANCGANLTPEALSRRVCLYCHTVVPSPSPPAQHFSSEIVLHAPLVIRRAPEVDRELDRVTPNSPMHADAAVAGAGKRGIGKIVFTLLSFFVLALLAIGIGLWREYRDEYESSIHLRERAMPGAMPYAALMRNIEDRIGRMSLQPLDTSSAIPPENATPATSQPRRGVATNRPPSSRPAPAGKPTVNTSPAPKTTSTACRCASDDILCRMRCAQPK